MSSHAYFAFLAAFVLAYATLPGLIRSLTRRRAEQVVSQDVPDTHQAKKGTPTLGGISIVLPAAAVGLTYAALTPGSEDLVALIILFLATSALGFYDDYLILSRGRNAGQKWSHKLLTQMIVGGIFVDYIWIHDGPEFSRLIIPGSRQPLELGIWWFPMAVVYLALMSNAVNLSDGLDGLAAGLSLIAAVICGVAAVTVHQPSLTIFSLALGGACLGFLWFNCHPAQIFMGNTSSVALGAALAGIALLTRQEILLLIPFGVFLAEAASVVIQVGYFKLTHERVFRKAPLHHHFEMLGWKETRVVARFWIAGILLALVARLYLS